MKSDDSINGVLLVDKGQDMTSHDVVAVARRCLDMKKIGHCGTLDPMATGMLILVLGTATRIQDLLMSEDKEYTGTLKLGATTNRDTCAWGQPRTRGMRKVGCWCSVRCLPISRWSR